MPNPGTEWTRAEKSQLRKLAVPGRLQEFLRGLGYPDSGGKYGYTCRSPRYVLRDRKAHCFEGALFAAAALEAAGHRPLLINLQAENDDEHVLAVYRVRGCWGAVSKSNFITLGSREPVYRTLRELVMSYFDFYFNTLGTLALRAYSRPVDLRCFDDRGWRTTDQSLEYIGDYLDTVPHTRLVDRRQVKGFNPVEPRLLKFCLELANPKGLFWAKPGGER